MSLADTFRDNLRNALQQKGLTQRELAQKTGVHEVTISRILKGKHDPTLEICEMLARGMKLPLDKIFARSA